MNSELRNSYCAERAAVSPPRSGEATEEVARSPLSHHPAAKELHPNAFLKCSGCMTVHYCSTACSKLNWSTYRSVCKGLRRHKGTPQSLNRFATLSPLCLSCLREFRDHFWTRILVTLMHAYRLATPTPLYYTHVVHIELAFDPRPLELAEQFTWIQGALLTHSEMAKWSKMRGEAMGDLDQDKGELVAFKKHFGQEEIMKKEGPKGGVGSVVVPFVLTAMARESEDASPVIMMLTGTVEILMPVRTLDDNWLEYCRRMLSGG